MLSHAAREFGGASSPYPRASLASIRQELVVRAEQLLASPAIGDMGHSEYDAAWVARVRQPDTGAAAFPEVLRVVRASQHDDGSWGPQTPYTSAKIIATLSSLLALAEFPELEGCEAQVAQAVDYLHRSWPRLTDEPELTVGFELLSASLLVDACKRGLPLARLSSGAQTLRAQKLAKLPPDLLYSPFASVGHSLEFLGDRLDIEAARGLKVSNGSIGATVSTTAYYAIRSGDPDAYAFLRRCVSSFGPERLPYGSPSRLWASIWALYNLSMGGLLSHVHGEAGLDFIAAQVGPRGLSWSSLLEYGDADDTAVGLTLLADDGRRVDWSCLRAYEGERCYRTYLFESHPSVSVNAHVLHAITRYPAAFPDASRARVLNYLRETQGDEGHWTDKWHASPYYATSRVIRALLDYDIEAASGAVAWMLDTRRDDGWGYFAESTIEETSYCVLALAAWFRATGDLPPQLFAEFLALLLPHIDEPNPEGPRLWIEKTLYRPSRVVWASVLAAAHACVEILDAPATASRVRP